MPVEDLVALRSGTVPQEPGLTANPEGVKVIDLASPEASHIGTEAYTQEDTSGGTPSDPLPKKSAPEGTPVTGNESVEEERNIKYRFSPESADTIISFLGFFTETPRRGGHALFPSFLSKLAV